MNWHADVISVKAITSLLLTSNAGGLTIGENGSFFYATTFRSALGLTMHHIQRIIQGAGK
jgi:hypothetical protein